LEAERKALESELSEQDAQRLKSGRVFTDSGLGPRSPQKGAARRNSRVFLNPTHREVSIAFESLDMDGASIELVVFFFDFCVHYVYF